MASNMPNKPKPPKPSANELELLRTLWSIGPSTVKEVHAARQRERPDHTYATVLRLMQVMHGKGLLTRDESERSHIYRASYEQDAFRSNMLDDLIQKVFADSGKDLVLTALSSHVSVKELEEIKSFLKENSNG